MKILFGVNVDFVDWRRVLLCVALPWPLPTSQQLVEACSIMEDNADDSGNNRISKEKFMATDIWLDHNREEKEEVVAKVDQSYGLKEGSYSVNIVCVCVICVQESYGYVRMNECMFLYFFLYLSVCVLPDCTTFNVLV